MNVSRADRRRFEKEFNKLAKAAKEKCTVCGKSFGYNSRTFGGLMFDGRTVLTGECCVGDIAAVMAQGLYLPKNLGDVLLPASAPGARYAPEAVERAIEAMPSNYAELDSEVTAMMQKAGVTIYPDRIHVADAPWKADDAAWFQRHSDRSHRLRSMFQGEAESLPPLVKASALPANHRLDIIVRQVEPGKRMRTTFCRNTDIDFPDHESLLKAIFDRVMKAEDVIQEAGEINDIAREHCERIA